MAKTTITAEIDFGELPEPRLVHFSANEDHGEFWVLYIHDNLNATFNSVEQLRAFDEKCHGDIEDALFRHAHGVSEEVAGLAVEQEGA